MENGFKINVHKFGDKYIGKIRIEDKLKISNKDNTGVELVVILDVSGSMGNNVNKIVTTFLPSLMSELKFKSDDKVQLITFTDSVKTYYYTLNEARNSHLSAQGGTYMAKTIPALYENMKKSNKKKIRLLTISDGDLNDQSETINKSLQYAEEFKKNYSINSHAIRLITSSYGQPDTKGLASVLQFSNINKKCELLDVQSKNDYTDLGKQIASYFVDDSLDSSCVLEDPSVNILYNPWDEKTEDKINLSTGDNIIWFKNFNNISLKINNLPVQVMLVDENVTIDNYDLLLKGNLDKYFERIKILKVINTEQSLNEVKKIVEYFSTFEKKLIQESTNLTDILKDNKLSSRLNFIKQTIERNKKTISHQMEQLANNDKVAKLNSAQLADYLRSTNDQQRTGRALARRIFESTTDLDFNTIIRSEVRQMHKHLNELNDIDSTNHTRSFYNLETTLDGIKTVCKLVDDNSIELMDINDILQLINIVGVACSAQIGDYPDPMTYRCNNLYPGCFVSLSDVLLYHIVSKGQCLKTFGTQQDIINVIPFFDDDRIHKFLIKYAPKLLEYVAGVGMRRVLGEINNTYMYTVCAGVWKMVEILDKKINRTSINIMTFKYLLDTYMQACGNYFDHLVDIVNQQVESQNSFFLNHCGITNMISPIVKLYRKNNVKHMSAIMRSLYSFEAYQLIKKSFKVENGSEFIKNNLYELLSIDLEKNKTCTSQLFENEKINLTYYDNYDINNEMLEKFTKSIWFIDYVVQLFKFIECYVNSKDNLIENIKNIPELSEDYVCQNMDIDYNLEKFKLFNIVQAHLYNDKQSRCDSEKLKSLIPDLKELSVGETMIKEYVLLQFKEKYNYDLKIKNKEEDSILMQELIIKLCNSDEQEFCNLLKNGISRNNKSYVISNSSCEGATILIEKLLNINVSVSCRKQKMWVVIFGKNRNEEVIWNNGNTLVINLGPLKELLLKLNENEFWTELSTHYKKNRSYSYRSSNIPNRHTHCADKPSYYAYGYTTLAEFIQNISHEEWETYKSIHCNCCGIDKLKN